MGLIASGTLLGKLVILSQEESFFDESKVIADVVQVMAAWRNDAGIQKLGCFILHKLARHSKDTLDIAKFRQQREKMIYALFYAGSGIEAAMDVAARLPTDYKNGAVTVSWEANEDVVITKSATWEWRVGEISFDKDMYSANEPVKFTLHDADLWIHHAEFFTYWMRVYSDSDSGGIYVPVQFIQNHPFWGR